MSAAKTLSVALLLAVVATLAVDAKLFKGPGGDVVSEIDALLLQPNKLQTKNTFRNNMLVSSNTTANKLYPGQEARVIVSTSTLNEDPSAFTIETIKRFYKKWKTINNYTTPAFNASSGNVRVRVIAAYTGGRASVSGNVRRCTDTGADVWSESWQLSPRTMVFGRSIVVSGYATFSVPPFAFKFCVKDLSKHNSTRDGVNWDQGEAHGWHEFANEDTTVYGVQEPPYYFHQSSTDNRAGDFAAIHIIGRSHHGRFAGGQSFNFRDFTTSDLVKFVPFGMPCTYEKETASNGLESVSRVDHTPTGRKMYCGSNLVSVNGDMQSGVTCHYEGAISEGIAHVGTNKYNPLATASAPSSHTLSSTDRIPVESGELLTAYVKLPKAGNYEICVSTRAYRRVMVNTSSATDILSNDGSGRIEARPFWFKAYNGNSGCTGLISTGNIDSTCTSKSTAYVVAAASSDVTWEVADKTSATWGTIKFTGSSALDRDAATAWDHSATREYATTAGGDMFRLVNEYHFQANPKTDFGNLYEDSNGNRFTSKMVTAETSKHSFTETTYNKIAVTNANQPTNGQKVVQYRLGEPGLGTMSNVNTGSGCFWGGADNYGTSSLLGNPGTQCCTVSNGECSTAGFCHMKESAHDGPNANADLGGDPRTPYAPHLIDGTSTTAWGYIRMPSSGTYRVCYRRAGGNWRMITMTGSSTSNNTLIPTPKNSGYEYHLNDTRAETWAAWGVKTLDKTNNALTTEASTFWGSATIAGSMFKIVKSWESCHLATAQSHGYSANPGTLASKADETSTAREWIYFYAKVPKAETPATTNKYRVCFRKGEDNWHALRDNMYTPVFDGSTALSSAEEFYPMPKPVITYDLTDKSAGSLAKFKFARSATHQFNVRNGNGDMVRLIKNVTGSLEHFCDEAGAVEDTNLGISCDSSTTGSCATASKTPSDGLVTNALYPYTTTSPEAEDYVVDTADTVLAFMTLPAFVAGAGYKVCYKQHVGANWIETVGNGIGSILTVTTETTVSLAGATSFQAGEYSYVTLSSGSGSVHGIYWDADLVKLVPATSGSAAVTCDGSATGSTMHLNEKHNTLVNDPSGPYYANLVDGTNTSQVQASIAQTSQPPTATARAYMIFPVTSGSTAASTAAYTVCYMRRVTTSEATKNWIAVGNVNVVHQGIVFAVGAQPQKYNYLTVDIISGGTVRLNTNTGMDRAKIVNALAPCTIAQSEYSSTSDHINVGLSAWTTQSDHVEVYPVSASGIADLGPGNEVGNKAQMQVLMPSSSANFKICYKPYGLPWIQLAQTETYADRGYNLTSSTFSLTTALVSYYQFGADVLPNGGSASNGKVIGGSTASSTSDFKVVLSASDTGIETVIKFVKTQFKTPTGFSTIAGRSCLSEGYSVTMTTSGSATLAPSFNMPTEAGKYLVCVGRSGAWHFAYYSNANPEVEVQDSELRHVQTGSYIKVTDFYGNDTDSFGSLHGDDTVYIVRANETCGAADFAGTAASTAESKLNATGNGAQTDNATLYVATRTSSDDGQDSLAIPTTAGLYKVCVKKSQATETYTTGETPLVRSAVYYQVPAADGNAYYSVSGAKKFIISGCSASATTTVAEGATVDIAVTQVDDNNVTWVSGGMSSAPKYANLAAVTPITSDFKVVNFGGECRPENAVKFGFNQLNLEQYLFGGSSNFRVAFQSNCPSGTCSIKFASGDVSTDSDTCQFSVTNVAADNLEIVSSPTGCRVGQACTFRVAALNANGVAYSSTDSVTLTFGNLADAVSVAGATTASFANGYADFSVTFNPAGPAANGIVGGVTVTATDASNRTSVKSLNVYSPTLESVHIVDVYPVDVAGLGVHPLTPTWEPTSALKGGDASGANSGNAGTSSVVAASGFHLVAKQFYNVVLRAVGVWKDTNENTYLTSAASFDGAAKQISIVEPDATNVPITAAGCTTAGCNTAFSAEAFNAVKKTVTFRLPNNKGCTKSDNSGNGCNIIFKFGAADIGSVTQITTPVRVVAQKMITECVDAASTTVFGTTPVSAPCTATSKVRLGWKLRATAVDLSGQYVDEFFDGQARVVFAKGPDGNDNGMGVKLTSVSALSAGLETAPTRSFSSGRAEFSDLTVSRPCPAGQCGIQVVSNWGGNIVDAGELVAVADTTQLGCSFAATSMMHCTVTDGVCTPVASTGDKMLLYSDTELCMDVQGETMDGGVAKATLYETNWVHYYATPTSATTNPVTLSITDAAQQTSIVKRYKPMKNGKVRFCFTVSAGSSTEVVDFSVTFAAQRFNDANYWANTAGTCTISGLTLWPKKLVAGATISAVTPSTQQLSTTLGSSVNVWGESTGSAAVATSFTFGILDHYGKPVTAANIDPLHKDYRIVPTMSGSDVAVAELGVAALSGKLNVTVDSAQTTSYVSNDTVTYHLNAYQYCLGCRVTFLVVNPAVSETTAISTPQVRSGIATTLYTTFYVVSNAEGAQKHLAFYPGTSPFTSNYWANGTASLDATSSYPAKLFDACSEDACKPLIQNYLRPKYHADNAAGDAIDAPGGGNIRIVALRADSGAALDSAFEATVTDLASAKFQADIMASHVVSVSVGNQQLTCTNGACTDDGSTSVSRTLAAFGDTAQTAATEYIKYGSPRVADFKLVGLKSSTFTPLMWNSTGDLVISQTTPDVAGQFRASSDVSGTTGISTGGYFVWQPQREPRSLRVLATAVDPDAANPVAQFSSYNKQIPAEAESAGSVSHAYATEWPAGVAFPISVALYDGQWGTQQITRLTGAGVTVSIDSWNGCNNGGTLTASGTTMTNGIATVTVSFSAPCENCVLKFELTSGITDTVYTELKANPKALVARSAPINIVATKPSENEHVVVTASTPDVMTSSVSLTVADTVQLTLAGRATTATLANSKITWPASNGYRASVSNRVVYSGSNGWWYGNGGVLRSTAATTFHSHALAETSGSSLTFSFTRTCSSCNVILDYRFNGRDFGKSMTLPRTFTVTSAQSSTTLVGFVPSQVKKNTDIAVALWHTGTDGGIIAGISTSGNAVTTARTATATVTDKSNGDGGLMQQTSWLFTKSEVHRLRFSRSCNLLSVSLGTDRFPLTVTTTATHLRPIFSSQTANVITTSIGGTSTFSLRAVDDLGFTDVTVGANSCSFGGVPFYCPASSAAAGVGVAMTFDGAGAAFPSADVTMTFALSDQTLTSATMAHGKATVGVTFPSPVRDAVPVFSVSALSSQLHSVRPSFMVPHVTVSNGLSNLELIALPVGDKTKVSTAGAFFVDVALVNALADDTNTANRYVAVDADHTVTMTAANCPPMSIDTETSFSLVKGYKRVAVRFTDGSTTATCALTFATSCTSCTATIEAVEVKKVGATSFQFLRPTMLDNNGAASGPKYGAQGRKSYIAVQLFGEDANTNAVAVGGSACASGCFMRVTDGGSTDSNCGFTPNKASEAFDVNGTAMIEVQWNDAGVASYACQLKVEVGTDSAFSTTLLGPDGNNGHTAAVEVCRPARVQLLTNTSSVFRGMFLKTGMPYKFEAQTVTTDGARCMGDSQDDATQLTIEAVKNDGTVAAQATVSTDIFATNVNRTATDGASVANGQMSASVARTTVGAVAGNFGFSVVFSNSTVALGLTGIRVRVTAASVAPDISGTNKYAVSGPVETVISASTLRFAPMYKVPKHVVTDRVIVTQPENGNSDIVVQAVDALQPMWDEQNLMSAPNVARGANEFGNDLAVFWQQSPAPADGIIRAAFQTGALNGKLVNGESTWTGMSWTGADGMYALSVAPAGANTPVQATKPISFMAQKPVALQLRVADFTLNPAKTCNGNCFLMNTTFTETTNLTHSATPFLHTKSLQPFNLSVQVGDAGSKAVMGDDDSVLQVTTVGKSSSSSLVFGRPPAYAEVDTMFARVKNGVAHFELGFLGSTEVDAVSGNHSLVELEFSCPTMRPPHLLKPFEAPANPCALASFKTMKILVGSMRGSNFFQNTPVQRENVKVEFKATSVNDVNVTKLMVDLAGFLQENGFPWLDAGKAAEFINIKTCGVTQFYDVTKNDLGGSVCGQKGCEIGTSTLDMCPPQVTGCKCGHSAARGIALSRYLLQDTNTSLNTSSVIAEFNFDLQFAAGFPGTDATALQEAYQGLEAGAASFLQTDTVKSEFGISNVGVTTNGGATGGGTPATLAPTPAPPVIQPPTPPAGTPTPPTVGTPAPGTTSASAISVLASALLAVVLALLA